MLLADKVWSNAEVARFLAVVPQALYLPSLPALKTGQRQGDLHKLTWWAYDGKAIKFRQRKTGAYVAIPVSDELSVELDAAPRVAPAILTNPAGKPSSKRGFQCAWGKSTARTIIQVSPFMTWAGPRS
jgi:integrase